MAKERRTKKDEKKTDPRMYNAARIQYTNTKEVATIIISLTTQQHKMRQEKQNEEKEREKKNQHT